MASITMCGRFLLISRPKELADLFQAVGVPALEPRYNIAPTQPVAIVRFDADRQRREFAVVRWGLIPHWAQNASIGNRLINARSETAAEKPAFRYAFRERRCLIPADGFYQWQKQGSKKSKQPFLVRRRDGRPFALAGLWEVWHNPDQQAAESCTILTTDGNEAVRPLHRMPAILQPKDYDLWLDSQVQEPERVQSLLRPYRNEGLELFPVSCRVNNPRNDDARCLDAAVTA
jgi:putative SOS response-associated peptidase YedK